MAIETIDDIVEQLANNAAIYGAHDEQCERGYPCRCCWTADLRARLNEAFKVEQAIARGGTNGTNT